MVALFYFAVIAAVLFVALRTGFGASVMGRYPDCSRTAHLLPVLPIFTRIFGGLCNAAVSWSAAP